ncbi:MAG TPA: magnesium/cobalt transporter CorA [Gemmatimonadaceae bacterium]|nr:magnesium/cobalt transporter CorA [Gemmatimonadaceae bacterium]
MSAPDAFVAPREANVPRSYSLDAEGRLRRDLAPRELVEALGGDGHLWLDVDSGNRAQVAILEKVFGFHPLAIEDTLNPENRAKVEDYGDYLFLVVRGIRFIDETEDPYDLETFNLYFFLGRNYLVTVHARHSSSIDTVAERIDRSPEIMARGAQRLLHAIVDAAIDAYFPIIDQLDEFMDGLEERVFARFDQTALRDIFAVKRCTLTLRRHLAPQREVFNILTNRPSSLLSSETQVYFRDVHDHVLRINESLETYRDLLGSTLDSYLMQVSNRLGTVTKALSVVATLSIPFVVVSGMWGMNFDVIPLSTAPGGFWIMLAAQAGVGAGLLGYLRWRGWL